MVSFLQVCRKPLERRVRLNESHILLLLFFRIDLNFTSLVSAFEFFELLVKQSILSFLQGLLKSGFASSWSRGGASGSGGEYGVPVHSRLHSSTTSITASTMFIFSSI